MPRLSIASAMLVSASLVLDAGPSLAATGSPGSGDAPPEAAAQQDADATPAGDEPAEAPTAEAESPVEGPQRPEPEQPPPATGPEPPPPTIGPPSEPPSGIEFAVPPPDDDAPAEVEAEPSAAAAFPDPGIAPNDGASSLVLGATTMGLGLVGMSSGLIVGLRRGVPLEWLLPSTLVPTIGVLAIGGGGVYLGVKRARAHRRWELAYRVIGAPQGGGLLVGGSFTLLGAVGLIPAGAFALSQDQVELGATMLALGCVSAVATPLMFSLGSARKRDYERTGGWRRRPIPELPSQSQLQLTPLFAPLPGGLSLGAAGRF